MFYVIVVVCCLLNVVVANNNKPAGVDEEEHMKVPELIQYYKYPFEEHKATTGDGYVLTMHRIPSGRDTRTAPYTNPLRRPPILMVHGLLSDAGEFLLNPPVTSPAYVFADAGFDVWMINHRGTKYSREHLTLNESDPAYWNFTWYEHAHFDLPAAVDKVIAVTGFDAIYYLGHSQGTVVAFAKLADDEDRSFATKIRQVFVMGPTAGINFSSFPLWLMGSPLYAFIRDLFVSFSGSASRVDIPPEINMFLAKLCKLPLEGTAICDRILDSAGIEKLGQYNESRASVYVNHFPTATSTLNILHWLQVIHFHRLAMLDRGPKENVKAYGQKTPPIFNISTIETPTYVYYSGDDTIADVTAIQENLLDLYGPGLKQAYCLDHFTHLDFAIGLRAALEVYRPMIATIYEDLKDRYNRRL